MTLEVRPVQTKKQREAFLRLPWRLYKDDPAWVPNLLMLQREVIDPKKNPFFEHAEAQLFLATRDGEPVGRISAAIDRDHNAAALESARASSASSSRIDDPEVAAALLAAAEAWLREHGMNLSRGPPQLQHERGGRAPDRRLRPARR